MFQMRFLLITIAFAAICASGLVQAESVTASLFGAGRPQAAKKAGPISLADGRVCIKSFPYPPGKFFISDGDKQGLTGSQLSDVRKEIELAIESSGSGETIPQDAIRRINKEKSLSKLSTLDQTYYLLNKEKIDAIQLRAYANFLELFKLSKEGDYQRVIEGAQRMEKVSGWIVKADPFAEVHATKDGDLQSIERDATYYSTQQLRNAISLLKVVAITKTRSSDHQTALLELIAFAEKREAYEPFFKNVGDPTADLLSRVSWLPTVGKGEPFWKQRESLAQYRGLQGILRTSNETVAYVGTNNVVAISFKNESRPRLVSAEEAAKLYDATLAAQTGALSKNGLSVASVVFDADRYEVRSGKMIATLSEAERDILNSGGKLPPEHSFTKLFNGLGGKSIAFFSHPLMQLDGAQLDRSKKLLFALRSAYPDKPIFLDPFSPSTYDQVKRINEFRPDDPKKLLVVIPAEGAGVTDYKIIQNISAELSSNGVEVVRFDAANPKAYKGPTNRGVIVITGHSDKALADWVRKLGEAGYFKNNVVVFNSCETPLTNQLIFEITTRFGAIGTYTFDGKILASAVEDFIAELATLYKKGTNAGAKAADNLTTLLTRVGASKKLRASWVVSVDDHSIKSTVG
jgi:hypothetical protein